MVKDRFTKLLAPIIEAMGYRWWGCVYVPRDKKQALLRIYIDRETGIGVEDCARVSRQVSSVLDVEDPISASYTFEVSSPGINRPLFTPAQYRQFIGERVRVQLHASNVKRRHILFGILKAVNVDGVSIQGKDMYHQVKFDAIARGQLCPFVGGREK